MWTKLLSAIVFALVVALTSGGVEPTAASGNSYEFGHVDVLVKGAGKVSFDPQPFWPGATVEVQRSSPLYFDLSVHATWPKGGGRDDGRIMARVAAVDIDRLTVIGVAEQETRITPRGQADMVVSLPVDLAPGVYHLQLRERTCFAIGEDIYAPESHYTCDGGSYVNLTLEVT